MAKARRIEGLTAEMPFAAAAAAAVRVRAGELLEDDDGDLLDTGQIERVHAMRVTSRRLRAVLEVHAVCFPKDELQPVLRDVKALADALGARRDPDVELETLSGLADALADADRPGLDLVAAEARAEQARGNQVLGAALAAARESDLHARLLALADAAEAGS